MEVLAIFLECLLGDCIRGVVAISVLQSFVAVKVDPVGYRDAAETRRSGTPSRDKGWTLALVQPLRKESHLHLSHPEHGTVAVEGIFSKVHVFETGMDGSFQDAVTDRLNAVVRDIQVSEEWQMDDLRRNLLELVPVERQMLQFGKLRERSRWKDG